jgi:hypothetical protein
VRLVEPVNWLPARTPLMDSKRFIALQEMGTDLPDYKLLGQVLTKRGKRWVAGGGTKCERQCRRA